MTQLEQLRAHFDAGGSLTVAEALTQFGVYALSQRCGELVKSGYPLHSVNEKTATGKTVKRYYKVYEMPTQRSYGNTQPMLDWHLGHLR